MENDDSISHIDIVKIVNRINLRKMPLLLICLLVIFLSLAYLAFVAKNITIVTYSNGKLQCNETFTNGKITSPQCPEFFKKRPGPSFPGIIQNAPN